MKKEPTNKELKTLIKWAEEEISEYKKFIKDCKKKLKVA